MTIKPHFWAIVCLGLCFCQKQNSGTAIPLPSMVKILKEFHLVEAGFHVENKPEPEQKTLGKQYYGEILKKYGFSVQQFQESKLYYNNHPELMDSIYAVMIREMNEPQDSFRKNKE